MIKFLLHDNSKNEKKYKLVAKQDCKIVIDYCQQQQEIVMEKYDEIKWDNNIVITYKNSKGLYVDVYKNYFANDFLKIYCADKNFLELLKINI